MENGIILGNRILDIIFVAWFLAQAWKVVASLLFEKKINFRRFIETGGMPSSHTSTVSALVTVLALTKGTKSAEFAIALIFAIIVMYDAAGVRRAAGKQARVLNKLLENISKKEGKEMIDENLKELLGHTPFEVFGGAVVGVATALVMYFIPYV